MSAGGAQAVSVERSADFLFQRGDPLVVLAVDRFPAVDLFIAESEGLHIGDAELLGRVAHADRAAELVAAAVFQNDQARAVAHHLPFVFSGGLKNGGVHVLSGVDGGDDGEVN